MIGEGLLVKRPEALVQYGLDGGDLCDLEVQGDSRISQLVGRWGMEYLVDSRPSGSGCRTGDGSTQVARMEACMEAFPASTPDANAALRIKDMHR